MLSTEGPARVSVGMGSDWAVGNSHDLTQRAAVTRSPLWRHRDFLLLWGGQAVSDLGSAITLIALPLVAVTVLHASTLEVALLEAAGSAAFLFVALQAGAVVDRRRKRPVLVAADLARALVLVSIPVAQFFDVLTLAQLYAVSLVTSVLTVFFDVTYQSYLPSVVKGDQLVDANGKLASTGAFAQFAGPSIGGLLVGLFGAGYAVLVDVGSFLVGAGANAGIKVREEQPDARPPDRRMRDDVREGMSYVLRHPVLSRITGCTGTHNFAGGMEGAVSAVYLIRTLHASPLVFGFVLSLGAVGSLVGAATAAWFTRVVGSARIIWLSVSVSGPFALIAAFAFPGPGVLLVSVSLAARSIASVVYNTSQVSYRQLICPPKLVGRMNASIRFLVWGTIPLGAAAGGAIATVTSTRTAVAVAAVVQMFAAMWVVRSPLFGKRDVPTLDEEIAAGRGFGVTETLPPADEPGVPV